MEPLSSRVMQSDVMKLSSKNLTSPYPICVSSISSRFAAANVPSPNSIDPPGKDHFPALGSFALWIRSHSDRPSNSRQPEIATWEKKAELSDYFRSPVTSTRAHSDSCQPQTLCTLARCIGKWRWHCALEAHRGTWLQCFSVSWALPANRLQARRRHDRGHRMRPRLSCDSGRFGENLVNFTLWAR